MKKLFFCLVVLLMFLFGLGTINLAKINNDLVKSIEQMVKSSIYAGKSRLIDVIVYQDKNKIQVNVDLIPADDFGSDTYGAGIKLDCYDILKNIYFKTNWIPKNSQWYEINNSQIRYFDQRKRIQLIVKMDINQAKTFPWGKYGSYKKVFKYCTINGTKIGKQGLQFKYE